MEQKTQHFNEYQRNQTLPSKATQHFDRYHPIQTLPGKAIQLFRRYQPSQGNLTKQPNVSININNPN